MQRQTPEVLYHCFQVQETFMCVRRFYNRRPCSVVQDATSKLNAENEFPVLLNPNGNKAENKHSLLDDPACTGVTKIMDCTFGSKRTPLLGLCEHCNEHCNQIYAREVILYLRHCHLQLYTVTSICDTNCPVFQYVHPLSVNF